VVVKINIDEENLQPYGYLIQMMLDLAILEVFPLSLQMKKNRPTILVPVICPAKVVKRCAAFPLRQTATNGFSPTFHEGGEDLWTRF